MIRPTRKHAAAIAVLYGIDLKRKQSKIDVPFARALGSLSVLSSIPARRESSRGYYLTHDQYVGTDGEEH